MTDSAAALGLRPVVYKTFCRYWQELLPHIVISKPHSNLCWTCQQNSTAIMKATNRSDREKDKVISVNWTFLYWFANGLSNSSTAASIRCPPFTIIVYLVKGRVFNCNHIFVNPILF